MRILKYIFIANFFLLILAVSGVFVARSILMYTAYSQLSKAVLELERNRHIRAISAHCQALGAFNSGDPFLSITQQIRFLSDTEYIQEGICPGFSLSPLEISRFSLPVFVSKTPGNSGIVIGNDLDSGVELRVFDAQIAQLGAFLSADLLEVLQDIFVNKRSLVLSAGKIVDSIDAKTLSANAPQATCAGWGYFCCDGSSKSGVGVTHSLATDCPQSCFSSCSLMPVVLLFNTEPMMDQTARSLTVFNNQAVTFNYVIDVPKNIEWIGTLDYGDGSSAVLTQAQGSFSRSYSCSSGYCNYQARLNIQTPDGKTSPASSINQINIAVQ